MKWKNVLQVQRIIKILVGWSGLIYFFLTDNESWGEAVGLTLFYATGQLRNALKPPFLDDDFSSPIPMEYLQEAWRLTVGLWSCIYYFYFELYMNTGLNIYVSTVCLSLFWESQIADEIIDTISHWILKGLSDEINLFQHCSSPLRNSSLKKLYGILFHLTLIMIPDGSLKEMIQGLRNSPSVILSCYDWRIEEEQFLQGMSYDMMSSIKRSSSKVKSLKKKVPSPQKLIRNIVQEFLCVLCKLYKYFRMKMKLMNCKWIIPSDVLNLMQTVCVVSKSEDNDAMYLEDLKARIDTTSDSTNNYTMSLQDHPIVSSNTVQLDGFRPKNTQEVVDIYKGKQIKKMKKINRKMISRCGYMRQVSCWKAFTKFQMGSPLACFLSEPASKHQYALKKHHHLGGNVKAPIRKRAGWSCVF